MRLNQDYSRDVFRRPECVAEVHRHWLQQVAQVKRPDTVPSEAVLVPTGPRSFFKSVGPHFWVSCAFNTKTNQDACTTWDEAGVKYRELECVNSANRQPIDQPNLVIDPLTTQTDYQIHLTNGAILEAP